jgi:hypothetical protein
VVPNSIKIPLPNEYALRCGALFLGVDPVIDWDRLGAEDNQARDENGVRLWMVKVSDQDPAAGMFGRSSEAGVRIAAEHQPVPPDGYELPGGIVVRPVEFLGLTGTPYIDRSACKGNAKNAKGEAKPHKCRARLAWSLMAEAMVAPSTAHENAQQVA